MFIKKFIFKLLNITKYSISFSALLVAHYSFTEVNAVAGTPNALVCDDTHNISQQKINNPQEAVLKAVVASVVPVSEKSPLDQKKQPKIKQAPGWPH